MSTDPVPRYIVMTSSARIPGGKGRYSNVAVVETDGLGYPSMISERAVHLRRIVRHWGACSVGKTERCQFGIALADAKALVEKLNKEPVWWVASE